MARQETQTKREGRVGDVCRVRRTRRGGGEVLLEGRRDSQEYKERRKRGVVGG